MVQRNARGQRLCGAKTRGGTLCKGIALRGATRCRMHLGNPEARARAAIRVEMQEWGLSGADVDPAETLLKLVACSARRSEHYAMLIGQAYEAAERLASAHESAELLVMPPDPHRDTEEPAGVQRAREDLEHVFTMAGAAALVRRTYASTPSGHIYASGEQIAALAQLESAERDRCARYCKLAIDAGLAERQVRLAEQQGRLLEHVLSGVLGDLGLTDEQLDQVPGLIERHLDLVAG